MLDITNTSEAALIVIVLIYMLASAFNLFIPKTNAKYTILSKNPILLLQRFLASNKILWNDKVGQISLAVTTLFWGAGATLQFIVLLWAQVHLDMTLDKAAMLQGIVAVGVILGSVIAGKLISLKNSTKVLPIGILMGLVVPMMTLTSSLVPASILLIIIGYMTAQLFMRKYNGFRVGGQCPTDIKCTQDNVCEKSASNICNKTYYTNKNLLC